VALNVQTGNINSPGAAGPVSITLPSGFDPKLLILSGNTRSLAGTTSGDIGHCYGFATKDGGSIQQVYVSVWDDDANATSSQAQGINTTACYKLFTTVTPTVGQSMSVAAAGDWSDTNITLTATAGSIAINQYMVLGGSDITNARCGAFALSTAVATQDVTSPGFTPDFLALMPSHNTALGDASAVDYNLGMGFAIGNGAGERYCSVFKGDQANATNEKASKQGERALYTFADNVFTLDCEADFDKANSPGTGFRLAFADQAARASQVAYLAVKGTAQFTVGSGDTLTAGGPQDLAAGFAPKSFLFHSTLVADNAGIDTTSTELGGSAFGVSDFTNHRALASGSNDTETSSFCWRGIRSDRCLYTVDQPTTAAGAPTERANATASASTTNVRLTYAGLDNVARRFAWFAAGDAAAAPASAPKKARRGGHRSQPATTAQYN
jgi:hypothetical protein